MTTIVDLVEALREAMGAPRAFVTSRRFFMDGNSWNDQHFIGCPRLPLGRLIGAAFSKETRTAAAAFEGGDGSAEFMLLTPADAEHGSGKPWNGLDMAEAVVKAKNWTYSSQPVTGVRIAGTDWVEGSKGAAFIEAVPCWSGEFHAVLADAAKSGGLAELDAAALDALRLDTASKEPATLAGRGWRLEAADAAPDRGEPYRLQLLGQSFIGLFSFRSELWVNQDEESMQLRVSPDWDYRPPAKVDFQAPAPERAVHKHLWDALGAPAGRKPVQLLHDFHGTWTLSSELARTTGPSIKGALGRRAALAVTPSRNPLEMKTKGSDVLFLSEWKNKGLACLEVDASSHAKAAGLGKGLDARLYLKHSSPAVSLDPTVPDVAERLGLTAALAKLAD